MRIENTSLVDGWHIPLLGVSLTPGEWAEDDDEPAEVAPAIMEPSAPDAAPVEQE